MKKIAHAPRGVEMATALAQGTAIGAPGASGFVSWLVRLPVTMFDALYIWQGRVEERLRLRQLDGRMLSDMGLSRADVEREASLPFWRAS